MTPAEARALYWEARQKQSAKVAPILAEVKQRLDNDRASPEARALQAKRSAAAANKRRHSANRDAHGRFADVPGHIPLSGSSESAQRP